MKPNSIAVVVPLYNGAAYIAEALDSVFAQTLQPAEVIVVDDGSTDGGVGADIVKSYGDRVRLVCYAPNAGQSRARNIGIQSTASKLIAFLDQDDVWYTQHLEKLSEPYAAAIPGIGWVYSDLDLADLNGRVILPSFLSSTYMKQAYPGVRHPKADIADCILREQHVCPSASLVLRAGLIAVEGFDENLRAYEDQDMFWRMFLAGYGNVFVDTPLSQYRRGTGVHASASAHMPHFARLYAGKLTSRHPDLCRTIARRFVQTAVVSSLPNAIRTVSATRARDALRDIRHFGASLPPIDYLRLAGDVVRWAFWRTARVLGV